MTMLASTINQEYTKYDSFAYRDAHDERWLPVLGAFFVWVQE